MIGWGITLIVIGFGSLILPYMGMQFVLMELLDGGQPFAGIIIGVLGIGLTGFGFVKQSE